MKKERLFHFIYFFLYPLVFRERGLLMRSSREALRVLFWKKEILFFLSFFRSEREERDSRETLRVPFPSPRPLLGFLLCASLTFVFLVMCQRVIGREG